MLCVFLPVFWLWSLLSTEIFEKNLSKIIFFNNRMSSLKCAIILLVFMKQNFWSNFTQTDCKKRFTKNVKFNIFFIQRNHFWPHSLTLNPILSTRKCPIDLKLYQITNFEMDFQRNYIRSRNSKVDFLNRTILRRTCP